MNEIIARMLHNGATIHSTAQDQWQLRHGTATVDLDCKSAFGRWYVRSFTIDQERVYLQEAVNAANANTLDKLAADHIQAMLIALDTLTNIKPKTPAPRPKARKNSKS